LPIIAVLMQGSIFFCERVVAVWNSLPILADNLKSIASFRTLLKSCDLSDFLYIL